VFWVIVNVEEWDPTQPMPRTVLTPPAGGSPSPDIPNWAWHEYGNRVGFWRLLKVFDEFDLPAVLAINGCAIAAYDPIVRAAMERKWEFMGHGFTQRNMQKVPDERADIRKTREVIAEATGKAPRGWLGPALAETRQTPDLLAEAGLEYVCDWVMDEQPCYIKTKSRPLVMVPYSVELNDIAIMMIQHHESRVLYERTMDQFERLYEDGQQSARVLAICVHPYISGVPHRIRYFERIFEDISKRPGVLFWKNEQILDWYKTQRPE
jgi:peptidoglycan/xylan/chitin deacetylase (PgdA/CDA1 family)